MFTTIKAKGHEKFDRRRIERKWVDRGALLHFANRVGVFSCRVPNITVHGAGARLFGLIAIPVEFTLSFDGFRTSYPCALVWRDGDFIGFKFMRQPSNQDRSGTRST